MYLDHHNEKLNRYKIRMRTYEVTGGSFLEIKFKNNKNDTRKKRTSLNNDNPDVLLNQQFITDNTPYQPQQLHTAILNSFRRMTFTDNILSERLTIDIDLSFSTGDKIVELDGLAIAEVKQSSFSNAGRVMGIFRELGIYPHRFSKYCIGQALLNTSIKINRFKPHLSTINKICHGTTHADHP
jgi:paraquat-inducible protein B